MQTAMFEILLGGEVTNTIVKPLSVPEALIIKRLHGDDALTNGKFIEDSSVSSPEESDRLKLVYGDRVFEACFPGSVPVLPTNFAAVGVEVEGGKPVVAAKTVASKSKEV